MKESFGTLSNGEQAFLYTISGGGLTACISDFGATLVRLYMPDGQGGRVDVVLGFDDANRYYRNAPYIGATIGRNANRIAKGQLTVDGKAYHLAINNGPNSLHSGPDSYAFRLWQVVRWSESSITLSMHSPDGDQGFPGNAQVNVTYKLEYPSTMRISYDAVADRDTVFNMTNHTYFNLAGHHKPECAMDQTLMMPARFFLPSDAGCIPTGEMRPVAGTPMDFREAKPIGQDIQKDYDCLRLQRGYDHNFEAYGQPNAVLTDPVSGRSVAITTDCPGLQLYSGNFLKGEMGKDGVCYCRRGGVAMEPQYFPDAVNHPEWAQPVFKANEPYHSETVYVFKE